MNSIDTTSKSLSRFRQLFTNATGRHSKTIRNLKIIEVLRFLPEYLLEFLRNHFESFDQKYGIDTSKPVSTDDLDVDSETALHAELYWPTNENNFRKLILAQKISHGDFTFIDIGSGKGRALLLAAEYGFKKIIGVEFSKKLTEIARKNILIFNGKRDTDTTIEIHNTDAVDFNFPTGPLFIYLFDPFRSEIMEKVILNLIESLKNDPRDVYVAYYLPMHKELFNKYGFNIVKEQPRNLHFDYPWVIFHKGNSTLLL